MKMTKNRVLALLLLVVVAALYRLFPNRPPGFAPQIAMAVFGGAIFAKDKKWAFVLPLLSMFVSDLLYQLLYKAGYSSLQGFYPGQWINYLLFAGLTCMGFLLKKIRIPGVLALLVASPTVYFLLSNLLVWLRGEGFRRPITWQGLLLTYTDGLPFYPGSLLATLFFGTVLFGAAYLFKLRQLQAKQQVG